MAVWAHPLDVHYSIKGIDGWPRLYVEVWGIDGLGRYEIAGYGCCIVPTTPGLHELTCRTWRPHGSMREQISSAFPPPSPTCTTARRPSLPSSRLFSGSRSFLPWWRANTQAQRGCYLAHRPLSLADRIIRRGAVLPRNSRPLRHSHRALTRPQVSIRLAVVTKDFARYGVSC